MNHYFDATPYKGLTPQQTAKCRKTWQAIENARKSTGPLTPEGKAKAAQNARKHGFASARIVLHEEDREAYDLHINAYFASFHPVTQAECDTIRRAAWAQWRYDRLTAIETGLLDLEIAHQGPFADAFLDNLEVHHYFAIGFMEQVSEGSSLELCRRYLHSTQRDVERAVRMFYFMKKERIKDESAGLTTVPAPIQEPENKPVPNEPIHIVENRPTAIAKPVELAPCECITPALDPQSDSTSDPQWTENGRKVA